MKEKTKNKIIVLHSADNVGVVISAVHENEPLLVGGLEIRATKEISFGHKIALISIAAGEVVRKYGVPIGEATEDIHAGDHVHTHNMKSLYMKQFTK